VHFPASQQTPCAQLGTPEQLTSHDVSPEQDTCLLHEVGPVHATVVVADVLEIPLAHARAPAQLTLHHSPVHEMGIGQVSMPLHWISHVVAVQKIGPVHAPVPVPTHPKLQESPAHRMLLVHERAPMQSMAQVLADWQSICPVHDPAPTHVTAHGMPAGQTMGVVQVPAAVHVTVHVPASSHTPTPASAQILGHTAAASRRFASPASASDVLESVAALPSLLSASASASRSGASASLVLASSAPNRTSGKEHAAPAAMPALAKAVTMKSVFFSEVSSNVNSSTAGCSSGPRRRSRRFPRSSSRLFQVSRELVGGHGAGRRASTASAQR
jgi:hypothetical protein